MRLAVAILALFAASAAAGQVRVDLGMDCTGKAAPARGCLAIDFSESDFAGLVDAVTRELEPAGGGTCRNVSCRVVMVCDQCSVDKRMPGCALVGDKVVLDRWIVTAHRVACLLTQIRGEQLARDVAALAVARTNRAAEIGVGQPDVRRACNPEAADVLEPDELGDCIVLGAK